ncbi:MAG: hypothetical protein O3B65_03990 [Chloroflexi bacterium]|nr:hypothetical protein [Chloroflexota bacterium]
MWSGFAIDYAILVFFSTLGAMQIVASRNGLAGIMLLRGRRLLSTVLGSGVIAAAFTWFFTSEFRNLPDTGAGLEANTQTATFALAGGVAVGVTFVMSSLVNHRWASATSHDAVSGEPLKTGLDVLRQTTFVLAIVARLKYWTFLWRTREQGRGRRTEADG